MVQLDAQALMLAHLACNDALRGVNRALRQLNPDEYHHAPALTMLTHAGDDLRTAITLLQLARGRAELDARAD